MIVTLIARGDMNAYEQLFVKYYSPLCEYASWYVSEGDAEELVQDLMLAIWENRKTIMIEYSLRAYLFAATRYRCLNAIAKSQYRQRIHDGIREKMKEQFESPDYYIANELSQKISEALAELPEIYRETFILSRFGTNTNADIALRLEVSVKTVEYRIRESLKILREKLKDYLPY